MVANDVDVYHGKLGTGDNIVVYMSFIGYIKDMDGLDVPINTVKCSNLSAALLISNKKLNATTPCLHVQ